MGAVLLTMQQFVADITTATKIITMGARRFATIAGSKTLGQTHC